MEGRVLPRGRLKHVGLGVALSLLWAAEHSKDAEGWMSAAGAPVRVGQVEQHPGLAWG